MPRWILARGWQTKKDTSWMHQQMDCVLVMCLLLPNPDGDNGEETVWILPYKQKLSELFAHYFKGSLFFHLGSTPSSLANHLKIPRLGPGSLVVRPPITAPTSAHKGCECLSTGPHVPTERGMVPPP